MVDRNAMIGRLVREGVDALEKRHVAPIENVCSIEVPKKNASEL